MNIIELWKYPLKEVNKTLNNKGKTSIEKYILLTELFARKGLLIDVLSNKFRNDLLLLNQKNMNIDYNKRINMIEKYMQEKISGIKMFVYFTINNNKLLLIGEEHVLVDNNSHYITDYLLNLIGKSNTTIDLFIESPFESINDIEQNKYYDNMEKVKKEQSFEWFKDNKPNRSPMGDLIYLLRKCNKKTYNQCYLDKLRYHLIDQRENIYGLDLLSVYQFVLINILDEYIENDIDVGILFKDLDNYFENNTLELFLYISGFDDQYKSIYDKYCSLLIYDEEKIKFFYETRWNEDISLLEIENINKSRENYINSINKQISKIENFDEKKFINCLYNAFLDGIEYDKRNDIFSFSLQYLETIKMDTYCMLRYLKTLNIENNHSIIYTGAVHTKIYLNFIKYYFNIEPIIEKTDSGDNLIILDEPFNFLK